MNKPTFNTNFEYDEWFDIADKERMLEDYFGKEVENGRSESTTD